MQLVMGLKMLDKLAVAIDMTIHDHIIREELFYNGFKIETYSWAILRPPGVKYWELHIERRQGQWTTTVSWRFSPDISRHDFKRLFWEAMGALWETISNRYFHEGKQVGRVLEWKI